VQSPGFLSLRLTHSERELTRWLHCGMIDCDFQPGINREIHPWSFDFAQSLP